MISVDEYNRLQDGRGSLEFAIAARRNEQIGRIVQTWKHGYYRVGDYVFVARQDSGSVTLEMPMTPAQIEYELSRRSLLRTTLTIINVPASYVEVLPEWVVNGSVS